MSSPTAAALVTTAVGVAVSPAPMIELILVLFSRRRTPNALAFVATLVVMTGAALALGAAGQAAASGSDEGTSTDTAIVLIVFAALLLALAWRNWRNRRDTSEPKVFATISRMGPGAAAGLAFGAVFVNPKNLILLLAAGQTIGAAADHELLLGAGFIVLATLPYTLAAGYALLGGERANARLDAARAWLVARNRLIMAIVLGVLAVVLFVKGVGSL